MKIIGDKNKVSFMRVFTPYGYGTDIYIEYHEYKNNLDAIKKIIATELGGDWEGAKVHLYTGISEGQMIKSLQHKGETAKKINSINNKLIAI